MGRLLIASIPTVIALFLPFCAAEVRPIFVPVASPAPSLWESPTDVAAADLFYGPWGPERAPDALVPYTLVEQKHNGVNPGMTVRDPLGRQWSVKQAPPTGMAAEGPIEVVVSRILSAVGYHQPPVYFLPAFTLIDDWGRHREAGGRFRLKEKTLRDQGEWSWQQNPFVGTRPYQGLLAVLLLVNSTDLKNDNNTIYAHLDGDEIELWYVVRDLGSALGGTGRLAPIRGDAHSFAERPFIRAVRNGFVEFDYRGWHQELVRDRITLEDVVWVSDLLAQLTEAQWFDAFRAAGYDRGGAAPFIRTLRARVEQGVQLGRAGSSATERGD